MNIGIFGGAFNPVHNGHLHLIDFLARTSPNNLGKIEKLIIIPTANPPHKTIEGLISGEHRINMLKLAVFDKNNYACDSSNVPSIIEISTIEFETTEKSYTYNTLEKLKKIYPNDNFVLFMGSDQFLCFDKWYKYEQIQKIATVSAITRNEYEREIVRDYMLEHKNDITNASVLVTKPVVVSSTEIRSKVKNGESISGLVPNAVEQYIKDNNLYV